MEKIVLFLFSFFAFQVSFGQQFGWVDLTAQLPDPDHFGGLGNVFFREENGWITESWSDPPSSVYYTPDAGQTFSIQELPDDAGTVGGIFIRENFEGYLVTYADAQGNAGNIFHCDDARTGPWSLYAEISGSQLYCITFPPLPATTGYIGSAMGDVWEINGPLVAYDANLQTNYDIRDLTFPVNAIEGWAADGLHIHHRNSEGWVIDQNFSAPGISSISFYDNLKGWTCGDEETILHTDDGHNWITQFSVFNGKGLNSIRFCDQQNGWAVGNSRIYHTKNGGASWLSESDFIPENTFLKSVYITSPNTAYAVGETGSLGSAFYKYMEITEMKEQPETDFTLSPNPANQKCIIQCSGGFTGIYKMNVINMVGTSVSKDEPVRFNNGIFEWDVSKLKSGLYLIILKYGNSSISRKFIKQ